MKKKRNNREGCKLEMNGEEVSEITRDKVKRTIFLAARRRSNKSLSTSTYLFQWL